MTVARNAKPIVIAGGCIGGLACALGLAIKGFKAYVETNGTKLRSNFMACAGYDGMAAIAEALKKTGGSVDPDKFLAALKGMKLTSPRGTIMIDPETRDIVQTVYIRRVEKIDGLLYKIEFD